MGPLAPTGPQHPQARSKRIQLDSDVTGGTVAAGDSTPGAADMLGTVVGAPAYGDCAWASPKPHATNTMPVRQIPFTFMPASPFPGTCHDRGRNAGRRNPD